MADMINELYTICDKLTDTLTEINGKLKSTKGMLSTADLDYVDKLTHAIKSVKTVVAMEEAYDDEYSEDYRNRRSYGRESYDRDRYHDGRRSERRDRMGRYSRDDVSRGYSRTAAKDEMIDDLRDMMKHTDDDMMRKELESFISKMESYR